MLVGGVEGMTGERERKISTAAREREIQSGREGERDSREAMEE